MKYLFLLALLTILGTCVRAQKSVVNDGFPVRTTVAEGELEGIFSTVTGVQHYLGVPFSAPPVGDLRWRTPQAPEKWEGTRMAKAFGPRAVQPFLFDDMRFRSSGMSEDCLYLNVWTPARKNDDPLPVLLYYHGGGDVAGAGDELRYDGEYLARQGVVVVTANYRLGVFGYLAHPELSAEQGGRSGNYGLLDQVAALDWVRANIAAFGGDPDRITIGGESAGSMNCSMHMASPLSRDKIAGVIGQSGAALTGGGAPVPQAEGEKTGEQFFANGNFAGLAAARRASTRDVYLAQELPAGNRINFPTVIDGNFLAEHPAETYRAGRQADVPLLVGWTSAETAWIPSPASAEAYQKSVANQFSEADAAAILRLYPADDYARSNMALQSDRWIALGTWMWSDLHARTGNAPVYRWQFDRIRPPLVGQTRDNEPLGAGHASDIEYFFNTLDKSDAYAWEKTDQTVAREMSQRLLNFVKTGNPNNGKLTEWPAVEAGKVAPVWHFAGESGVKMAGKDERYRVLEKVLR